MLHRPLIVDADVSSDDQLSQLFIYLLIYFCNLSSRIFLNFLPRPNRGTLVLILSTIFLSRVVDIVNDVHLLLRGLAIQTLFY